MNKKILSISFIIISGIFSLIVINETVDSISRKMMIGDNDPNPCGFYYQADSKYYSICKQKREWNIGVKTSSETLGDIPVFLIASICGMILIEILNEKSGEIQAIKYICQSYFVSSLIVMTICIPLSFTFINTFHKYGNLPFHFFEFLGSFIFMSLSVLGEDKKPVLEMRKEKVFSISAAIFMIIMSLLCISEHWTRNTIEI